MGWTRLVLVTASVMSVSLGCAGSTPRPVTPGYFRSPTLDYAEAPRSASDGEVLGAHQRTDDWLLAGATNTHLAPGWSGRYGRLHFERERAAAGHGVLADDPSCLPAAAPLAPEEAREHAAVQRAWLTVARETPLPVFASAVTVPPAERSSFLACGSP
jgi:hypothetical protein